MKTKKRKKTNVCRLCGNGGQTSHHHVFYGSFRQKSEQLDLVVEVCFECHRKIHDHPSEYEWLKKQYQKDWEELHSHEEWMQIFHRNWLINQDN